MCMPTEDMSVTNEEKRSAQSLVSTSVEAKPSFKDAYLNQEQVKMLEEREIKHQKLSAICIPVGLLMIRRVSGLCGFSLKKAFHIVSDSPECASYFSQFINRNITQLANTLIFAVIELIQDDDSISTKTILVYVPKENSYIPDHKVLGDARVKRIRINMFTRRDKSAVLTVKNFDKFVTFYSFVCGVVGGYSEMLDAIKSTLRNVYFPHFEDASEMLGQSVELENWHERQKRQNLQKAKIALEKFLKSLESSMESLDDLVPLKKPDLSKYGISLGETKSGGLLYELPSQELMAAAISLSRMQAVAKDLQGYINDWITQLNAAIKSTQNYGLVANEGKIEAELIYWQRMSMLCEFYLEQLVSPERRCVFYASTLMDNAETRKSIEKVNRLEHRLLKWTVFAKNNLKQISILCRITSPLGPSNDIDELENSIKAFSKLIFALQRSSEFYRRPENIISLLMKIDKKLSMTLIDYIASSDQSDNNYDNLRMRLFRTTKICNEYERQFKLNNLSRSINDNHSYNLSEYMAGISPENKWTSLEALGSRCKTIENIYSKGMSYIKRKVIDLAGERRGYEQLEDLLKLTCLNLRLALMNTEVFVALESAFQDTIQVMDECISEQFKERLTFAMMTEKSHPMVVLDIIRSAQNVAPSDAPQIIDNLSKKISSYFEDYFQTLTNDIQKGRPRFPAVPPASSAKGQDIQLSCSKVKHIKHTYDQLIAVCPQSVKSKSLTLTYQKALRLHEITLERSIDDIIKGASQILKASYTPLFIAIRSDDSGCIYAVNMSPNYFVIRHGVLAHLLSGHNIPEFYEKLLSNMESINRLHPLVTDIILKYRELVNRDKNVPVYGTALREAIKQVNYMLKLLSSTYQWSNLDGKEDLEKCLKSIQNIHDSFDQTNFLLNSHIYPYIKVIEEMELVTMPPNGPHPYSDLLTFMFHTSIFAAERLSRAVDSLKSFIIKLIYRLASIANVDSSEMRLINSYDQLQDAFVHGGYNINPKGVPVVVAEICGEVMRYFSEIITGVIDETLKRSLKRVDDGFIPIMDLDEENGIISFESNSYRPPFTVHVVLNHEKMLPEILPPLSVLEVATLQCYCYVADIGRAVQPRFRVRPELIHDHSLADNDFWEEVCENEITLESIENIDIPYNKELMIKMVNTAQIYIGCRHVDINAYLDKIQELVEVIKDETFNSILRTINGENLSLNNIVRAIQKLAHISSNLENADIKEQTIFPMVLIADPILESIVIGFQEKQKQVGQIIFKLIECNVSEIWDFIDSIKSRIPTVNDDGYFNSKELKRLMTFHREIKSLTCYFKSCIPLLNEAVDGLQAIGTLMDEDFMAKTKSLSLEFSDIEEIVNGSLKSVFSMLRSYEKRSEQEISAIDAEVKSFANDFATNGPLVLGVTASEGKSRMHFFRTMFEILWQKYAKVFEMQLLLALNADANPIIFVLRQEFELLEQLYGLYDECADLDNRIRLTPWKNVDADQILDEVSILSSKSKRLSKRLKIYPAYTDLKLIIEDLLDRVPLLDMMVSDAMQERHWESLNEILEREFDPDNDAFFVGDMFETAMLEKKELVEDVCVTALKEKDISNKLQMIDEEWKGKDFVFAALKEKGEILLKGQETSDMIAAIEETNVVLSALSSNRYNTYFQDKIKRLADDLSVTQNVMTRWIQVQNLYVYLEAVFVGGDIAKQLPVEARLFTTIDRTWIKMINRAKETPNVVSCCISYENNIDLLDTMLSQLESCLNSLAGYLETKRKIFPRFYFLSEPVLLEILGQASDPKKLQPYFSTFTESVHEVEFRTGFNRDNDFAQGIDDGAKIEVVAMKSRENEHIPLAKPVSTMKRIEVWLGDFLSIHQQTVKNKIEKCVKLMLDPHFDYIAFASKEYQQFALIVLQLYWTVNAESSISKLKHNVPGSMQEANRRFEAILEKLVRYTLGNLSAYNRKKFETLITIHIHQRDTFEEIVEKQNVSSICDFDWLKQCRLYFDQSSRQLKIRISDVNFDYSHEFLECSERLVITPLTDRCYISLAQALGMCYGGSPAGPAGTGKTETTKDMARTIGKYCIVLNCSDQFDYKGLGKTFKGLAQSGCWGCFDEFNRINLSVLSVAAQQIQTMLYAKREEKSLFTFTDADQISLDPTFAVIITMNPGYAGRQELPENLKVNFRVVAMMVPDRQIIIRVKLASSGFAESTVLSQKFYLLYKLCEDQLSKQVHYDFGLRNILAVLRTLGAARRSGLKESESQVVQRVLRDMNLSKLIDEDEPLFSSLLNDLFPGEKLAKESNERLQAAIDHVVEKMGLTNVASWNEKIVQLYETQLVRHGIMVLGPSGSGKTSCIQVLEGALSLIGTATHEYRMNPKAITATQMFGALDVATNDWTDGIFSTLWRRFLQMFTISQKRGLNESTWMVLDGPVDAVWIENLNSVLDDNKLLTLANGDRIPMASNLKIIFEVHSIENASPATVSRNGMVYMSSSVLPWTAIAESWVKQSDNEVGRVVMNFLKRSFDGIYRFCTTDLEPKVNVYECNYIKQLLDILDGLPLKSFVSRPEVIDRFTVFALAWSFGALLGLSDRIRLEAFCKSNIRFSKSLFAELSTGVFNYFINEEGEWELWDTIVSEWKYPEEEDIEFSRILVPNKDSVQTKYLMDLIAKQDKNVLLTGEQGTAKTAMAVEFLDTAYDHEEHVYRILNFSSVTTPSFFQCSIESYLERKLDGSYGPPGEQSMTIFIDDISMPMVNEWGDQVANEIVRQLIEFKGFYSLDKPGEWTSVSNLRFIAAMVHPYGGRNDIPERLKRQFCIFNCSLPSDETIDKIFGSIAHYFCKERKFSSSVIELIPNVIEATRFLWQDVKSTLLPTPAKFHYVFNLRDLSRIWEGMLHVRSGQCQNPLDLVLLWKHECSRVLRDRLVDQSEIDWFNEKLEETAIGLLPIPKEQEKVEFEEDNGSGDDYSFASENYDEENAEENFEEDTTMEQEILVDKSNGDPLFCNFLRLEQDAADTLMLGGISQQDFDQRFYEQVTDIDGLSGILRSIMNRMNAEVRGNNMDLVFFKDAIEHLLRISRLLNTDKGHALLVGVGGSGKQSLSRLAAYINDMKIFRIQVTRTYNISSFLDDMRTLFKLAIKRENGVVFILSDNDINDENMLEYVNIMLTTGEIVGLFSKEDTALLLNELSFSLRRVQPKLVQTHEVLMAYFRAKIRKNLHMILCFSPDNKRFRERAMKFPGLISGCTIDYYHRWPIDALLNVSREYINRHELDCNDHVKESVVQFMATVHNDIRGTCETYFQKTRRRVHVTPKTYLSFLLNFLKHYDEKKIYFEAERIKMITGVEKLAEASEQVKEISRELQFKEKDIIVINQKAGVELKKTEGIKEKAESKAKEVKAIKERAELLVEVISSAKKKVDEQMEAANEVLMESKRALKAITAGDIEYLRKLNHPPGLIMIIVDSILPILRYPLESISFNMNVGSKLPPFYKPNLNQIRKMLFRPRLLETLYELNPDYLNDEMLELTSAYFNYSGYTYEKAKSVFQNLAPLVTWGKIMDQYYIKNKEVVPLKEDVRMMQNQHDKATKQLTDAATQFALVDEVLQSSLVDYNRAMAEKDKIQADFDALQAKRDRAASLVMGLASEKKRWSEQSLEFERSLKRLVGDALLSTAYLTYCGAFDQDERVSILSGWMEKINNSGIPHAKRFDLINSFIDEAIVDEWNLQGLPSDQLSTGNGIIITNASRYPLLIDPQLQGKNWILRHFPDIVVTTLDSRQLRTIVENSLSGGYSLLLEDIEEEIDPIFDNILDKNYFKLGTKIKCMVGDRDVDVHPEFQLFFTTKLANPSYSPEISARCTLIDFAVTMQGLEEQLLAITVMNQKAYLEKERINVASETSRNKRQLKELEDVLLEKLSSIEGSVVEDEELLRVLNNNREVSAQIKEKMIIAKKTKEDLILVREQYRDVAIRGSILYFLITQMAAVNIMYQTSLAQFIGLFVRSMTSTKPLETDQQSEEPIQANLPNVLSTSSRMSTRKSRKTVVTKENDAEPKEIKPVADSSIVGNLTRIVWLYISRGLYRVDRSIFTLLLALRVAMREERVSQEEFLTLIKGGAMLDLKNCPAKVAPWIQDAIWLNLVQLSYLPKFNSILSQFSMFESEWKRWISLPNPEDASFPGDMNSIKDSFERLIIVRSCAPDRTLAAARTFINDTLGQYFANPYIFEMKAMLVEEGSTKTPFLGLLTSGSDPTNDILLMAKQTDRECYVVSMGQGQEEQARLRLEQCRQNGHWLILQNCHLGLEYMNELYGSLGYTENTNPNFRMWLTTEVHPDFPIQMLQACTKFTSEPPQGVRAGILTTMSSLDSAAVSSSAGQDGIRIVYALAFLHSILQERRKYGPVGWNVPYEFSQTDFEATFKYIQKSVFGLPTDIAIQWDAIQYMIAEIQYGGRVTDDFDRRILEAYTQKWFGNQLLEKDFTFVSSHHGRGRYHVPEGQISDVIAQIESTFSSADTANLFGLHPNADITYQARRAQYALTTIVNIQPKDSFVGGGETRENVVLKVSKDILSKFPSRFIEREIRERIISMGRIQPMTIFLHQEINRMQKVLNIVRNSLTDLQSAIDGLIIMTDELRQVLDNIYDGRVPPTWAKVSWTSSALGFWLSELKQRHQQLHGWLYEGRPKCFWFSGFFNPAGFVTAMRQEVTRRHADWALDSVRVESKVLQIYENDVIDEPVEGVYIYGLSLEGAGWDVARRILVEATNKVQLCRMPIIHLYAVNNRVSEERRKKEEADLNALKKLGTRRAIKPMIPQKPKLAAKTKEKAGPYECPVYRKAGRGGLNYITSFMLSSNKNANHWVLRGVALICDSN